MRKNFIHTSGGAFFSGKIEKQKLLSSGGRENWLLPIFHVKRVKTIQTKTAYCLSIYDLSEISWGSVGTFSGIVDEWKKQRNKH
jgi:hypothetical protein